MAREEEEEEGSDRVSGIDDPGEDRGEFFPVGFEDAADQKSGRGGRGREAKTHGVRCHRVTDGPVCPSKAYLVPTNPAPRSVYSRSPFSSSNVAQREREANLDADMKATILPLPSIPSIR